jgi:hypothetical protein
MVMKRIRAFAQRAKNNAAEQRARDAKIQADRKAPQAAVNAAIDRQRQSLAGSGPQRAGMRSAVIPEPQRAGLIDRARQQPDGKPFMSSLGTVPPRRI